MISFLLAVFTIQQILDIYTTHKALSTGKAAEANPAVQWFLDQFGSPEGLIVMKAGLMAFIFSISSEATWFGVAMFICVGLYSWVLYNNFKVLNSIGDSDD